MGAESAKAAGAAAAQTTEGVSLLDQVIAATRPQDNKEAERSKSYLKQFLESVASQNQVVSKDTETTRRAASHCSRSDTDSATPTSRSSARISSGGRARSR